MSFSGITRSRRNSVEGKGESTFHEEKVPPIAF